MGIKTSCSLNMKRQLASCSSTLVSSTKSLGSSSSTAVNTCSAAAWGFVAVGGGTEVDGLLLAVLGAGEACVALGARGDFVAEGLLPGLAALEALVDLGGCASVAVLSSEERRVGDSERAGWLACIG